MVLAAATFLIPPIVEQAAKVGARGAAETVAVSLCFITSAGAAALGLSPLLGAYAAGLAAGESKAKVEQFVDHLRLMFGSLFFTYVGTLVDARLFLEPTVIATTSALAVLALLVKTLAAAAPAALKFAPRQALSIGMGMVPMGDLGLVLASMALQTGVIGGREYAELVGVVAVTTFIAPALFTRLCRDVGEE